MASERYSFSLTTFRYAQLNVQIIVGYFVTFCIAVPLAN